MMRPRLVLALLLSWPLATPSLAAGPGASLRFEVTMAKGLREAPAVGRLLILLGRKNAGEPRLALGVGKEPPIILGRDVERLGAGESARVDETAAPFPLRRLADLPRGEYAVQALLDVSRDLRRFDAPGNLYSDPERVFLDSTRTEPVPLTLTRRVPAETLPAETEHIKFVRLRSELLSRFHGRPFYLRAGVILPDGYDREPGRRYPLRIHIGGYGARFTTVQQMMAPGAAFRKTWLLAGTPRMILLHLDGAGPYGDPYQVNSANNGPYGDAILRELIPHVEKRFRAIGRPYARVLDGVSTGGWASLALQVFYPDAFNGAWVHCPDPVDFRALEVINLYADDSAYVNRYGFERPSMREASGDVRLTVRHECRLEAVFGRGGRWTLSGRDWAAWNAAFGPRGDDGLPQPIWDGRTGRIDRTAAEHWQKYDLRLVMQKDWKVLGPKLRGKLHIWVGEADEFFLNNAVHLLDDFLTTAKPAYGGKITYGPRKGHFWRGLSEQQMLDEMAAAVERGRKAPAAP